MTLTPQQRYYRKQKKQNRKNYRQYTDEDGKRHEVVTKKSLTVRISREAKERLAASAKYWKQSQGEVLTTMIIHQTERYAFQYCGDWKLHWPESLMEPRAEGKRPNKGGKDLVMLNCMISSTAYNRLTCHSNAINYSKARIVEDVILQHVFTTEHQRAKAQERRIMEKAAQEQKAVDRERRALRPRAQLTNAHNVNRTLYETRDMDDDQFDQYIQKQSEADNKTYNEALNRRLEEAGRRADRALGISTPEEENDGLPGPSEGIS